MPQKNSSTNPAQAQTKALTKRNFHLPKTEDEAPPQNTRNIRQPKKLKKKNSPESTSAPHNKQPRQESLATPKPPNPKPSTSSDLQRTPPNPLSQEKRRPSATSEFQWTDPNPPSQENRRQPPIINRSREDFEAIPNVLSSKWIESEYRKR